VRVSALDPTADLVFMLRFLYVFGGAIEAVLPPAAGGSYINWLVPGILAQFAVFGASATACGTHGDRATGVLDRLRSLPMAGSALLAGRTAGDLIRSAVILLRHVGVGVLLGFQAQTGIVGVPAALVVERHRTP
jgi:ABC-type multidrug transport system permease subunit